MPQLYYLHLHHEKSSHALQEEVGQFWMAPCEACEHLSILAVHKMHPFICVCASRLVAKKRMKIAEGVCFKGLIFIDKTNDPTNSCECRLVIGLLHNFVWTTVT